ncbi:peptidylprolyl isomerase [Qipengyuania vesicularis]|uniref:peptidylprolyl isomerase n=1 Tax=Qipengyuania vesicularis TaxID=2867232 RepID=UPI001C88C35B|nr:peptidylprolyl isomerase [Qipengyuania vesicularis]MBX7528629.1 peptidylprolyl isomerase [Qipengyuania vesicularis]
MTTHLISLAAALAFAAPLAAQDEAEAPPSPGEIVDQAAADEWKAIPAEDLLVMTLAPDSQGNERQVVIQLLPAPYSETWTANIRTLARTGWYDGIAVIRSQDNYVVQWGDPETGGQPKPLPPELLETTEADYISTSMHGDQDSIVLWHPRNAIDDNYAGSTLFYDGWPLGFEIGESTKQLTRWPLHCYGMVGVARSMSPNAGDGSSLYTVIGHAPRHLDRNIALAGRIVEGMEHLSTLPRGKGALGFYEDASRQTPIVSVRVASDLPARERPEFEFLDTEGETFNRYAEARMNRRDPFFIVPAGGADICNIPVPVRRVAE